MKCWKKAVCSLLWAALLCLLCSCVSHRVEKRPVYPYAFAPEEKGGLRVGHRYTYEERQRLKGPQGAGAASARHENFIPARLERFQGNPHLMR